MKERRKLKMTNIMLEVKNLKKILAALPIILLSIKDWNMRIQYYHLINTTLQFLKSAIDAVLIMLNILTENLKKFLL